ncbi:MAG: response regulator [Halobacteriales archaeon]
MDRDPEFAELTALFLERNADAFVVETETRPRDALDRLAAAEFDCVVSDCDLRTRDGSEFVRRLHAIDPGLPVVLYAWKAPENVLDRGLPPQVAGFLQKSTDTTDYGALVDRIEDAIGR